MKILDRYIFCSFLITVLLWFISFVGIYVIFDLLTNFDGFFGNGGRNPFFVIVEYYYFKSFLFIDMMLPLLILVSAISVISAMIWHNEVIALMAIGISHLRVIAPILAAACVLSFFSFYVREYYQPRHMTELVKKPEDFAAQTDTVKVKRATDMVTRVTVDGKSVTPATGKIIEPNFSLPPIFAVDSGRILAESAVFCKKTENLPAGYRVSGLREPLELLGQPSIRVDGSRRASGGSADDKTETTPTVVFSPFDTPSLSENECFIASGIFPEILALGDEWRFYASTPDLIRAVKNPSLAMNKKDLQVRIHSHFLRPLSDLLPLLLALPILFQKNDRNIFKGMTLGMILAGVYIGVFYASQFAGVRYDIPILAAWAPLIIFVPITVNVFADLWNR